jgi:putative endonuclease
MNTFFVYILASKRYGTLYVGVTNSLLARVASHREGKGSAFTRKYRIAMLVYFEEFADVREAIQREKSLKRWPRDWKTNLIERSNPDWHDLFPALNAKHGIRSAAPDISMGPRDKPEDDTWGSGEPRSARQAPGPRRNRTSATPKNEALG